jgi:three-Cys-motif partner protein
MTKQAFVPEVGSWAKQKLSCLKNYLEAYTTILSKQKFKGYVYIDAFAGSGTAKIKTKKARLVTDKQPSIFEFEGIIDADQVEYISGSPIVALNIKKPFSQYVFIERERKRLVELNKIRTQYASINISVYDVDCNEYFEKLFRKEVNWKEWRGVIFLDPFGTHAPWKTVEAIAKTKSFEVFVNFPCMAINRLADNDGKIKKEHRQLLDKYFGSAGWFDVMFKKHPDLFGETLSKQQNASKALLEWYTDNLRQLFGYASSARLILNSKNSPLYYLIWAGPNGTGCKIADYILSKGAVV